MLYNMCKEYMSRFFIKVYLSNSRLLWCAWHFILHQVATHGELFISEMRNTV
uniref:Uncharacterized protein n=1 Tax=Anguilla anguilla TaxID=7936 RepID=A0A0E9PV11_ANGAN